MIAYMIGALAARVATVLAALVILLPYILRGGRLSGLLGLAPAPGAPYLKRLWPHFYVGYAIFALATLHAGTSMGAMGRANAIGISAATIAFFLLLFEVVIGLSLKDETISGRRSLRRLHFWTMSALVAALVVHLGLNRR